MSENKVTIRPIQSNLHDEYEFAEIVYKHGDTGKEHNFSIWHSMDNIVNERINMSDLEESSLEVFMSDPSECDHIYYSHDLSEGLFDSMYHTSLSELVDFDTDVEKALLDYHNGDIDDFNIEIPAEKQNLDSKMIIANEEIADVILKEDNDSLEKNDLVELGKYLQEFDLHDGYILPDNVKESFNDTIKKEPIKEYEKPFLKTTFESFNIETDVDFSMDKNKENEDTLER